MVARREEKCHQSIWGRELKFTHKNEERRSGMLELKYAFEIIVAAEFSRCLTPHR